MRHMLVLMVIALCCASSVKAEGIFPDKPHIYVEGKGEVKVEADRVTISCGLRVKGATMAAANAEIEKKSATLVKLVKKMNLDAEKVRADTVNLRAKSKHDDDGNEIAFLGYEGTRNVRITLKSFDRYPEVMRQFSESKLLDSLNSTFYAKDAEEKMLQARDRALDNAREQAKRMAKRLGKGIGKPYSVTEIDVREVASWQLAPSRYLHVADPDASLVTELNTMAVPASPPVPSTFIEPYSGKATAKVYVVFLLE